MNYHSGLRWQRGSGIGSLFSGIFRGLMPVARSAVKTIGKVARSAPIRSAGKALKKEATKAAVETALEALEGQPVGRKAKQQRRRNFLDERIGVGRTVSKVKWVMVLFAKRVFRPLRRNKLKHQSISE